MQHFLCISIHPRLGEERQGPARPPPGRHALPDGPAGAGGVVQQHEPQANEVEAGAGAGPGTEESWKRGVGENCLVVGGCTRHVVEVVVFPLCKQILCTVVVATHSFKKWKL